MIASVENSNTLSHLSVRVLQIAYCAEAKFLMVRHFLDLVVLRLNVPVNNFSVMSGRSHRFLGN